VAAATDAVRETFMSDQQSMIDAEPVEGRVLRTSKVDQRLSRHRYQIASLRIEP